MPLLIRVPIEMRSFGIPEKKNNTRMMAIAKRLVTIGKSTEEAHDREKHKDDGYRTQPHSAIKTQKSTRMMAIACRSLHFRRRGDANRTGGLRMLARVSGREANHPRPADGKLRATFVPAIIWRKLRAGVPPAPKVNTTRQPSPCVLHLMVASVGDRLEELEQLVQKLSEGLACLEGASTQSTSASHIHINVGGPSSTASAAGPGPSAPAAASETASEPSDPEAPPGPAAHAASPGPTSLPAPRSVAPTAGLDSCMKQDSVFKPNEVGEPGVYRRYQAFADAVRESDASWTGRGRIPWAAGATGSSYGSRRAAEEAYRAEFKLDSAAVVLHWD